MKNKVEIKKITDNPCTVTNTHGKITSVNKWWNMCVCKHPIYPIYVPDVVCYCPERYIFLHTLLLQAVSRNMERLTFLFVLSIETKKIKWRDWVAVRWRSIQTWEKEQEWERDSHEIRIAVCATNAEKSIEGCCSVAALWRPMKLDRISSKTNLRLCNKKIFTLSR
jgi:hypothetical protein